MDTTRQVNTTVTRLFAIEYCLAVFDKIQYASWTIRKQMVMVFIVLALLSILANGFAVFAILKTGQYRSQSTRLILFSNIGDILSTVFINFNYAIYMVYVTQLGCSVRIAIFVFSMCSLHLTSFLICLIGIDRYLRIRNLDTYQEFFTPRRYNCALIAVVALVILQSLLTWIDTIFYGPDSSAHFTLPINLLACFTLITSYVLSIIKLKSYAVSRQNLSNELKDLIYVASLYIFIFGLSYCIGFIYQLFINLMLMSFTDSKLGVITFSMFFLRSICGITNAVLFIRKNNLSKTLFLELVDKIFLNIRAPIERNIVHPA